MTGDGPLSAVLDGESEATDKNGNGIGRYAAHGFLSRYDCRIGVDSRGLVAHFDGEHVQTALLDNEGSIVSLSETPLWGESPAEHVLNTAERYGRWRHLEPEISKVLLTEYRETISELTPGANELRYTAHARDRWDARVGDTRPNPGELIGRSVNLRFGRGGADAYYDPETSAVLIVDRPSIVTVYPRINAIDDFAFRRRVRRALARRSD